MSMGSIVTLVLAMALFRIMPHPYNFTPLAGFAIWAGAQWGRSFKTYTIALVPLFLSDLILGLHVGMLTVYFAFILSTLLGSILFQKEATVLKVAGLSLSSSVVFFVISNLSVWFEGTLYTKDLNGLALCFAAAIPFFQMTALGDLIFSGLFMSAKTASDSFTEIQRSSF